MSVALSSPMSLAEFLAWEREQEFRYEFDGVQPIPVAMTGGTAAHSRIAANLLLALAARLRPPFEALRGDMKILVAGRIRYPDLLVVGADVPDDADFAADPVVVVEVLSASTAIVDRNVKLAEHQATPSIQHYVMLEQSRAEAAVLSRGVDGWTETRLAGPDAVLALPAVGTEVPLHDLYRRLPAG